MRILDIINETNLTVADIFKTNHSYRANMIALIDAGTPLEVVPSKKDKFGDTVVLDKSSMDILNSAEPGKPIVLKTEDGESINLTSLEKTLVIKGGDKANLGYIGEISLGVAVATRFLGGGKDVDPIDFMDLAQALTLGQVLNKQGKAGSALRLSWTGKLTHLQGKEDILKVDIKCPGEAVKEFIKLVNDPGSIEGPTRAVILSALRYAREEEKIKAGLAQASKDPNTNTIQVISDGISDNKGTKADLVLHLDNKKINLLSVKTGNSQLGQASGHEWSKQLAFFKTVFGYDASQYQKLWGTTTDEHIVALRQVWANVIPIVQRLAGGNSAQKEATLVKSIANGLIRYSNNYDEKTGAIESVDIVKLVVDPNSPGYKLMKIDSRLIKALAKVDLIGSTPPSNMGINIHGRIQYTDAKGNIKFKDVSLCRMWTTKSGTTVRTNVAGGPLLDELALLPLEPVANNKLADEPTPATRAPAKTQSKNQSQSTNKKAAPARAPEINLDIDPTLSQTSHPDDHISQV